MKKIIAFIMIVVIMVGSTVSAYADTSLPLTNPVHVLIAVAMVATGVVWSSTQDMQYHVTNYFNGQSAAMRQKWINTANMAKGLQYAVVANDMHQNLKGWLSTSFNPGVNTVGSNSEYLSFTGGYPASPVKKSDFPYQSVSIIDGDAWLIVSKAAMYTSMYGTSLVLNAKQYRAYSFGAGSSNWQYRFDDENGTTYNRVSSFSSIPQTSAPVYGDSSFATVHTPSNVPTRQYSINVGNIAFDPAFDWANVNTGNKAVPYPGQSVSADGALPDAVANDYLANDVIGLTSDQIINMDYSADLKPLLDEILSGVTGVGNISADIKSAVDAQSGVLSEVKTGINALTGELTGVRDIAGTIANDVSATRSAVESMTTTTGQLDWTPLRQAGDAFTQVFPFSLPWDLYRLIDLLDAEPIEPLIEINMPDIKFKVLDQEIMVMSARVWAIDMTPVTPYFAIWRTLVLFLFFVVLVMKTRTLMGGDV